MINFVDMMDIADADMRRAILSIEFMEGMASALRRHFAREEDVMIAIEYPKIDEHVSDHFVIVDHLDEMIRFYSDSQSPHNTLVDIASMINNHLTKYDVTIASFIKSKRLLRNARTQEPGRNKAIGHSRAK